MKRLIKKSSINHWDCDYMLMYLNGEFRKGTDPFDILKKYELEFGEESPEQPEQRGDIYVKNAEEKKFLKKTPFMAAYIDSDNLVNVDLEELKALTKNCVETMEGMECRVFDNNKYDPDSYEKKYLRIAKSEEEDK